MYISVEMIIVFLPSVVVKVIQSVCIWTNKMHKILVIRLYFPLDALHVSDYITPSSGATFISCTSHLVYAGIYRYHTCGYSHTTATRMVPAYTKCEVQLIKLLLMVD